MKKAARKKRPARSKVGGRRKLPPRSVRGATSYPKRISGMKDRYSDLMVIDLLMEKNANKV
jgi:hypothetical protein